MALKQQNRSLHLTTALGEDVLLLTSFTGSEEISRLFRYQLELVSDDPGVRPEDIVGTPVGWSSERADGTRRHWHGFVSQLARGDVDHDRRRTYRVEVVPWLWFLTQTSDCKIFQEKKVPEIVDDVLADFGFADYQTDLILDHKRWEYCVQYRESDFNFLSRLMEQEGIYYYFKHSELAHQMVITDHKDGGYPLPESEVNYPVDTGSTAVEDHLTSWERRFEYVSGKFVQRDFNFKTPTTDLLTQSKSLIKLKDIEGCELYDYPGDYPDTGVGEVETKIRIEAEESRHDVVNATSFCKTFQVGGRFRVGEHRDPAERGGEWTITAIQHSASEQMGYETGASGGPGYRNAITCIPADRVFRPARSTAKPSIGGVQTAIVTGPQSEEIYPDEFGRVKCQFHWDRYGQADENSSCWIRVSQIHAGSGFGAVSLPRVGEEVVVSFLEGDPDRPLITGRVYHAQNMPPYPLPDGKKISGMKSKTYKGEGYNEYVMDDTPGDELIREHGQYDKDSTIEHDLREHVHNDRSRDVGNDETVQIANDQSIQVGNNRELTIDVDDTQSVGGNRTITIGAARDETVGTNRTATVGANDSLDVAAGRTVNAGTTVEVNAGVSIRLVAGPSMIELGPSGIKISGPMIDISGMGPVSIVGAVVKVNS